MDRAEMPEDALDWEDDDPPGVQTLTLLLRLRRDRRADGSLGEWAGTVQNCRTGQRTSLKAVDRVLAVLEGAGPG